MVAKVGFSSSAKTGTNGKSSDKSDGTNGEKTDSNEKEGFSSESREFRFSGFPGFSHFTAVLFTSTRAQNVSFEKEEVIYYACVAVAGCLGGLFRQWRDGKYSTWRHSVGCICSAGLFAFGSIGLWVGPDPAGVAGPMYYLSVAAFVGFYAVEVHNLIQEYSKSIMRALLKKFGIDTEQVDGDAD